MSPDYAEYIEMLIRQNDLETLQSLTVIIEEDGSVSVDFPDEPPTLRSGVSDFPSNAALPLDFKATSQIDGG